MPLVVILFVIATYSQEPLSSMVGQLEKTPTDSTLREKIIRLAIAMKPVPGVPEDARRSFIRGNTAIKDATSQDDYVKAEKLYDEALSLAPWWADAYFNRSKAEEMHQDYGAAIESLKFFLMTSPPPSDVREAQDHIYALEEKRDKKLAVDKTAADESRRKDDAAALADRYVGSWYRIVRGGSGNIRQSFSITKASDGSLKFSGMMFDGTPPAYDVTFSNDAIRFTVDALMPLGPAGTAWYLNYPHVDVRNMLTPDGQQINYGSGLYRGVLADGDRKLSITFTVQPARPGQQEFWDKVTAPNDRFGIDVWLRQ